MNKSKQLAKLIGIEPDCDCHGSCNLADKDKYCKICKPLSREYLNFKSRCPNQPKSRYPDFTEPVNFVKLLEIIINNHISVEFDFKHNKDDKNLVYFNSGDAQGSDIVDTLINYINESVEYYEFEGVEESINNLKYDLVQENWEYTQNTY